MLVPRPDTETLVEAALRYGDSIVMDKEKRKATTEQRPRLAGRWSLATEITENQNMGEELRRKLSKAVIIEKPNRSSSLPPIPSSSVPSVVESPWLRGCISSSHGCLSASSSLRVHEPCTGSGCVAISLAAERPEWKVSASDISEAALEVASANASVLLAGRRPGGRLALSSGDLLAGLLDPQAEGRLDLVVANPPYVPSAEAKSLLERGWSEPLSALDGGEEGLEVALRLVAQATRALAPGGCLLVEADGSQAAALAEAFEAAGFAQVESVADLGGRARVTAGRLPWTA